MNALPNSICNQFAALKFPLICAKLPFILSIEDSVHMVPIGRVFLLEFLPIWLSWFFRKSRFFIFLGVAKVPDFELLCNGFDRSEPYLPIG